MSIRKMSELKNGERGKIISVESGGISKRLKDMGLVSGSEVELRGRAPLGDPIEIRVKGYNLSLRQKEADRIMLEVM